MIPGDTFLRNELKRLDLLLHGEILRLRARYRLSLDEFRGLYISDRQVDALVNGELSEQGPFSSLTAIEEQAQALYSTNRKDLAFDHPWSRLIHDFDLSPYEQEVLLLALAPELKSKYETIYAYLNNDVTRKKPTHALALNLFTKKAGMPAANRQALQPGGRLYGGGLLQPAENEKVSWLNTGFDLAAVVVDYFLGIPVGNRLPSFATIRQPEHLQAHLFLPRNLADRLKKLPRFFSNTQMPKPLVVFVGRQGAGRSALADRLANGLGMPLVEIDMAALKPGPTSNGMLKDLSLQSRLLKALLYIGNPSTLFGNSGLPIPEAQNMLQILIDSDRPICIACQPEMRWQKLHLQNSILRFDIPVPSFDHRRSLWSAAIQQAGLEAKETDLDALCDRFVLTHGQIREAVNWIKCEQHLSGTSPSNLLPKTLIFNAARGISDADLGKLAVKVDHPFVWDDLVLPVVLKRNLKEVAAAIKHRQLVYTEWGMQKRFPDGGGLKVMFSGASGTGKTMTASVLAGDLGVDLYKIDLSGVVSKYIGETEKNLDGIFRAAETSNAILFFDEADALFGKRSEVKDAHDRYANIEVAYLLQKMEEYAGIVILASNLSKNIDQAFMRRMHYTLNFPRPAKELRESIWRGMFPPQAPLADDVDFAFLARQFDLTGGDIKTIVLDAAFLAAENGRVINMEQIVKAMARQMVKQGKIVRATEFKQYHPLITQS